jgi:hypothetical protein
MMMPQRLPEGWTQERIQRLISHYENQTEDEAVAEDEEFIRASADSDEATNILGEIQHES